MNLVDNAVALRVLYLLVTPFDKWPAYHEGIIDKDGNALKNAQSFNWTMLHRLVARLKMLLGKLPGGKTKVASYLAAYLLVKENMNTEHIDYSYITENDLLNVKYTFDEFSEFARLIEDGEMTSPVVPANNTENIAGVKKGDEPPINLKKRKKNVARYFRRVSGVASR